MAAEELQQHNTFQRQQQYRTLDVRIVIGVHKGPAAQRGPAVEWMNLGICGGPLLSSSDAASVRTPTLLRYVHLATQQLFGVSVHTVMSSIMTLAALANPHPHPHTLPQFLPTVPHV